MADETVKYYPGTNDISDQFSAANIQQALNDYNQIKGSKGDYTFGDLTVKYYNLLGNEKAHWKSDVGHYPKDVQNEIKRHVIAALTNVDDQGNPSPIPLSIDWDTKAPKAITCNYDPSGPSYNLLISGYPSPLKTRFAGRRGKY